MYGFHHQHMLVSVLNSTVLLSLKAKLGPFLDDVVLQLKMTHVRKIRGLRDIRISVLHSTQVQILKTQ